MGMYSTLSRFGKRQLWDGRLNEALLCHRPGHRGGGTGDQAWRALFASDLRLLQPFEIAHAPRESSSGGKFRLAEILLEGSIGRGPGGESSVC